MTAEKPVLWRENGYTAHGAAHEAYANSLDKAYGFPFKDFVQAFDFEVWRRTDQRWQIAATRERDLYSPKSPSLFVWKSIGGRSMAHIENMGRRFTARAALDNLPLPNVRRGGALGAKPDPVYRKFLKDWQEIQWAREDAATDDEGNFDPYGADVPLRAVLGGMQLFTPWRKNGDAEDWDDYVRELKKETHKRPKGYAPWRPHKKTSRLIMQVKEILKEYEDHLPLTNRQIFYRLVAAYGYPKTENFAKSLGDHLTRARRAKMIPFEHIRDDGISLMDHAHFADENAFYKHVREEGNAYKRDKLVRQGLDIRVYCEAAGMMPQLERVCEPYSIPVYSCSGFDSVSAKYQLSTSCWQSFVYRGRRTVILHLGDHDPSGESIFNHGLVQDVHAFLAQDVPHKDPREVCDFERVALTQEQVLRLGLETTPPKDTDSRTANWTGSGACQLEALPPSTLAELLESAIRRRLDMAIYAEDLKAEEEERRRITKALPAASEAREPEENRDE
jgi:hypothetical protein